MAGRVDSCQSAPRLLSKRSGGSDTAGTSSPAALDAGPPKVRRLAMHPCGSSNVHDLFAPPKELLRVPKPRRFKSKPWKHAAEKPASVIQHFLSLHPS